MECGPLLCYSPNPLIFASNFLGSVLVLFLDAGIPVWSYKCFAQMEALPDSLAHGRAVPGTVWLVQYQYSILPVSRFIRKEEKDYVMFLSLSLNG